MLNITARENHEKIKRDDIKQRKEIRYVAILAFVMQAASCNSGKAKVQDVLNYDNAKKGDQDYLAITQKEVEEVFEYFYLYGGAGWVHLSDDEEFFSIPLITIDDYPNHEKTLERVDCD